MAKSDDPPPVTFELERSASTPATDARCRRWAVAWCAVTLLLSVSVEYALPANGLQFALGMWAPALVAIAFLLAERIPLRAGLNLHRGSGRAWKWAVAVPCATAFITAAIGVASGELTRTAGWKLQPAGAVVTLAIWVVSSLGEELGWRGYLHNHLRGTRHAPLWIGLVWAAWHHSHLVQLTREHPFHVVVFVTMVIETSYVLSWLIRSGGGILAAGFYHGLWNFLRMKILFGNPSTGVTGLFASSAPLRTEMEGVYGVLGLSVISAGFVWGWYRRDG